jgi:hypothetical protein
LLKLETKNQEAPLRQLINFRTHGKFKGISISARGIADICPHLSGENQFAASQHTYQCGESWEHTVM